MARLLQKRLYIIVQLINKLDLVMLSFEFMIMKVRLSLSTSNITIKIIHTFTIDDIEDKLISTCSLIFL